MVKNTPADHHDEQGDGGAERSAVFSRLDRIASWSSLLRFSISPLLQISYASLFLAPSVAILLNVWNFFLFSVLDAVPSKEMPFAKVLVALKLDMPMGLLLAYVSVLSYILSTVILQIFCPSKIKEHKSYHRYLGFLSTQYIQEMDWRKRLLADLRNRSSGQSSEKNHTVLDEEDRMILNREFELASTRQSRANAINLSVFSQYLHENLPNIWNKDNYSLKLIRLLNFFLFIWSFLCLAFVLFVYTPLVVFSAL